MAFLCCSILLSTHTIEGTGDLPFHAERIKELVYSMKYGNFLPQFNLNSMGQNGGGALVMYPYITLIPIAIFFSIFHFSIGSFYFVFFLLTLCSLLISYYSSLGFEHNKTNSILFSILYSTSSMFMNYWFNNGDIGVVLVITFLPLVIFGYLSLINYGKWFELATGMILIIFSHVLSPVIIVFFLLLLSVFYFYKFLNKEIWINIVKAVLMILVSTAFVWMPAYNLLKNNNNITNAFSYSSMNGTDLFSTSINGLLATVNFSPNFTPTFFAVLAIYMIPLVFYKRMNKDMKILSIVSILSYVLTTNLIPWPDFSASKIAMIQFPWRLDFFPQILLTYIFSYCIIHYLSDNRVIVKRVYYSILILAMGLQFYTQYEVVNMQKQEPELNKTMVKDGAQQFHLSNGLIAYKIVKNKQITNFVNSRNAFFDYYPNSIGNNGYLLSNDTGTYTYENKPKTIQFKTLGNGKFYFNSKDELINELNIPFLTYNGIDYKVNLDGKNVKYERKPSQIMTVPNISKGKHILQISVLKNTITKVSRFISLIGVVIYAFIAFKLIKHRKRCLK